MHSVLLTFHALIELALSLEFVVIFIFGLLGVLLLLRRGLNVDTVVTTTHVRVLHALDISIWVVVLLLLDPCSTIRS